MPEPHRYAAPPKPKDDRPSETEVRVFELDLNKPVEAGKNPLQIARVAFPFEHRLPRREKAALDAAKRMVPNRGEPELSHSTEGGMLATFVIPIVRK